jgi:hypothetical protein
MNWSHLVELMLFVSLRADVGAHTGNVRSEAINDDFKDIWRTFGNPASWRNGLPLTRTQSQTNDGQTFINILNDGRI